MLVSTTSDTTLPRRACGRPDPDRDQVASFIRARRKANRLTQRELAELAGVGVRLVSELERGKPTARLDAVNAVLAVFGAVLGVVDLERDR